MISRFVLGDLALVLTALAGLLGCAPHGRRVKMVYPQKTTYVDAVALDGGEVSVPPRVLEMVHPIYPGEGAGDPAAAWAIVRFVVDERGRVREVEIVEATEAVLKAAAVRALAGWKLRPATRDGGTLAVRATVRLTFDPPSREP